MPSKNLNDLITNLLIKSNKCRLKKKEVSKILSKKQINILIKKNLILKEERWPKKCLLCNNPAECEIQGDKLIVKDTENPQHCKEVDIDEYIIYEIDIINCFSKLIYNLLLNTKIEQPKQRKESCKIEISTDETKLLFICSISEKIRDSELFDLLGNFLIIRIPIVVLLKRTDENVRNLDETLSRLPCGNLVYPLYLEDLTKEYTKDLFKKWIEKTKEINEIENNILETLPENRRNLVAKIDTNPKYLISFMTRLKTSKFMKNKDINWKDFENTMSIIFYQLFATNIERVGGPYTPENIFFIRRDNKNEIVCVVDAKFSKIADLSKEKTEKYESYIKGVREHQFTGKKVALIFPMLKPKSESSIKEFHGRLYKKMKEEEYCIILEFDLLERLVEIYLSLVLKGKIDASYSTYNQILLDLFDIDGKFLNICKVDTGLYWLKLDKIDPKIKELLKSDSNTERIVREIYNQLQK